MSKSQVSTIFHIAGKAKYFVFLAIGCYFIFQGDVLSKFSLKRTSFAEYNELITEHPTILTKAIHNDNRTWIYGKDFNITYKNSMGILNLTIGENAMTKGMEFSFEQLNLVTFNHKLYHAFFVTPVKLATETDPEFELTWTFDKDQINYFSSHLLAVSMTLSTENNSLPCVNSDMAHCSGIDVYLDGDCKDVVINLGQNLFANIYPVKFLFLEEQENCRKQPYNEEILKGINGKINESCPNPCRPNMTYGRMLDKLVNKMPICLNEKDTRCYDSLIHEAKNEVFRKPCTKLEYRMDGASYSGMAYPNQASFFVKFSSMNVSVKEEYLIYDLIAVISALGGTMGLCIGFSFDSFTDCLFRYLQLGLKWAKEEKNQPNQSGTKVKPAIPENEQKDMVKETMQKQNLEKRVAALEKYLEKPFVAFEMKVEESK